MNALELTGITKRFGSVLALDTAELCVRPGTVHAVLGENGAGKTTLMRVAWGLVAPDAGIVRLRGVQVRFRSPADARAAGIGMVHQHFTVAPALTVAENLALGIDGPADPGALLDRARAVMERTGLMVPPDRRVASLSVGEQQRVEILKAVARETQVLILDEPTAVLAPSETDDLLEWVRTYAGTGRAVVLITHKLSEATRVADDVTVLRGGRTMLTTPASATTVSALVEAMLGSTDPLTTDRERPAVTPGRELLRLQEVSVAGERGTSVDGVSCTLRAGELVGIAAVEGAGHHELLRVMAGRLRESAGQVVRPERVAFVPEDRHRDAIVLPFTLAENLALRDLAARRGAIDWATVRGDTERRMQAFDVRAPGPDAPMGALSGGNQQKFVLARELDPLPDLVIAENPTRGLDVRATAAVRDHLRDACTTGAAVVFYSSDVDEVLAIADRILVMHAGRLREVPRDRALVGRAMLGLSTP